MTIYDKVLIRAMKQAYRDGGYDVAVTDHGVLIQADGWGVEILGEAVPNSVISLIVLHNGSLPRMDSAVHVSKGECADAILEMVVFGGKHVAIIAALNYRINCLTLMKMPQERGTGGLTMGYKKPSYILQIWLVIKWAFRRNEHGKS